MILKKGDITKETVDVIVNSNNQNLDLNLGKYVSLSVPGCVLQVHLFLSELSY